MRGFVEGSGEPAEIGFTPSIQIVSN